MDQQHAPIHAIRVVISGERKKYEYHGDIESVLKRICRVAPIPQSAAQGKAVSGECFKWSAPG
jgi:hypothetical protein